MAQSQNGFCRREEGGSKGLFFCANVNFKRYFFFAKKNTIQNPKQKTLSLLFWILKREKSFEKKEEEEDDASSGDESGRRSGEKENADADSDAADSDDDFGDFRSRATSERQSVLEKGRLFNDFQSKRVSSVFFFFFFFFIVCAKLCVFENDARDDARDNNSEGRKTGERKSAGVVDAESFE